MMGQRAAAADALGNNHLAAMTAQQADGGVVDISVQRPRAANQQRHRMVPSAAKTQAVVQAGRRMSRGAISSIACKRRSGISLRNGRASFAPASASRNRVG